MLIGLESPSVTALSGIEIKQNWKARQLPDYKEAIKTIQAQGISVNGCFILGLDGQGSDIFDDAVSFC